MPDPAEVRRYIDDPDGFYGYDYVFLEEATWNALCEIAQKRGCAVDELCGDIDPNFAPGEDFAPAARELVQQSGAARRYPQQEPYTSSHSGRILGMRGDRRLLSGLVV